MAALMQVEEAALAVSLPVDRFANPSGHGGLENPPSGRSAGRIFGRDGKSVLPEFRWSPEVWDDKRKLTISNFQLQIDIQPVIDFSVCNCQLSISSVGRPFQADSSLGVAGSAWKARPTFICPWIVG